MNFKIATAVAILSTAIAAPAFAQDPAARTPSVRAQQEQTRMYQRDAYQRDTGFWPGDVAAGVVGGAVGVAGAAVGTAGAIATAPFRNDAYAYNDGYYGQSYAARNGFVCQPGTMFRGEDGRRHICQ